jgi:hypothetical protein
MNIFTSGYDKLPTASCGFHTDEIVRIDSFTWCNNIAKLCNIIIICYETLKPRTHTNVVHHFWAIGTIIRRCYLHRSFLTECVCIERVTKYNVIPKYMGPRRGARRGICPLWNSNRMLNILTFIFINKHFIDIFTLVCEVGIWFHKILTHFIVYKE